MRVSRRGFSLIELLVTTAIAGLVGATVLTTLRRQERFYGSATEIMNVRSQLRDAGDVLVSDIRGANVARYGFALMTDTAVELFATVGTSVVCAPPSGKTLFFPPATLASGTTLTSLLATPDSGDLALVYATPTNNPDSARWIEYRISSFSTRSLSTTCPASTGFTSAADAARSAYALTVPIALDTSIHRGAPVRFIRRGRYSLYRSSDGEWYLGYRRCNALGASSCSTIQPVSGPYQPYSKSGSAGLGFRYFDTNGIEITDASLSSRVARVDVILRGSTSRAASLTGDATRRYRDSVVVSIAPRNRLR
jgi:prepilin-type N-terminal cleavage/methylation domain-containing protein